MPLDFNSVKSAVSAVNSGKHNFDHVSTLRKTKKFLNDNKAHHWNKSAALHKALRSVPGLKERAITRDNLIEELVRRLLSEGFDPKELKMGIEVEKEHGDHDKSTDVFKGSDAKSRKGFEKIAKAHLKEIPDYYTRLKKMEREGKKAHGIKEASLSDFPGSSRENKDRRMKLHISAHARRKGLSGEQYRAYVYGAMRERGWRPKREMNK